MKLAFLIQLILLLLLVVSLYMVFTNSVGGRAKLIMIVFCVVIGIYLFQKLKIFNDYDEFHSTPTSARAGAVTIDKEQLKKSEGHFAVSMWIFIDDWNYNYGETKNILKKVNGNGLSLPHIYLGAFKNDLHIDVDMFAKDSGDYETLISEALTAGGYTGTATAFKCKMNSSDPPVNTIHETDPEIDTGIDCPGGTLQSMKIENINMQKWVNIITTVNNRTLDVYINGKLIKTKTFDNIIDPVLLNSGGIELVSDGGFGGFFSKVQYYPYFITPEKAWSIYKGGFGDAFESALDRYNMSLSFYKDSVEQNKMYLF